LHGRSGPRSSGGPRLDELYVTASLNGGDTQTQLDGLDQLAYEQRPARPRAIERLRHEEQGTARAQGIDLPKHAPEEEKSVFERDILVKKCRAGSQQHDQSYVL
jgi:hypothetical protein